jgi:hypothetical protein
MDYTLIAVLILVGIAGVSGKISEKMDKGSITRLLLRKIIPMTCTFIVLFYIFWNFINVYFSER